MKKIHLAWMLPLLVACAGNKAAPDAPRIEAKPILEASDSRIAVSLDAVVVRNGTGAWTSDAHWDEYRFRARSLSAGDLRLSRIVVVDALGTPVNSTADRGELLEASGQIGKRYATAGGFAVGGALGYLGAGGLAAGGLTAGAAAAGAILAPLAVVMIGVSVTNMVDNAQVASQLQMRQTALPLPIGPRDSHVVAFFPIAPLPSAIELSYVGDGATHVLLLDTRTALSQAHIVDVRPRPSFPAEAIRRGLDKGHVRAVLTVDARGAVTDVKIVEASSPVFIEAATDTFRTYTYRPAAGPRTAEELMAFKRGAGP